MKVTEGYDLSIDTGEVDEEGNPIYEQVSHLEETVANGKQLKRVANKGHTQSAHLKDDSSVDLYQDDQLLATWQIIPQYWHTNEWRDYTKVVDLLSIVDGHLVASGEQGGFSWDIDIAWTSNDSKWEINVNAPGFLFRFKWNIVFTSLGQSLMADSTLKLGYEDYPGETQDDEGTVERNIIFEPDGVNDSLVVDPYLSIVESASEYNIYQDGFRSRFYRTGDQSVFLQFYTSTNINIYGFYPRCFVDGVGYTIGKDLNRSTVLLENTSTRVVIKLEGIQKDDSYVALTNLKKEIIYFYFYPDRIVFDYIWEVETASITLDYNANNYFIGVWFIKGNLGNERSRVESSGSEINGISVTYYPSADYLLMATDELHFQMLTQYHTDPFAYTQQVADSTSYTLTWNNAEMGVGIHRMSGMYIIDSIGREDITPTIAWSDASFSVQDLILHNGIGYECISAVTSGNSAVTEPGTGSGWTTYWIQCHKYTSTDRLAMGVQYHDIASNTNLPDIVDSTGSFVTDLNIPSTNFSKPGVSRLLNIDHPLANGLVGCWLMNEGSGGTVYDLTSNNYDLTVTGATFDGLGLAFDGTNNVATNTVLSLAGETDRTIVGQFRVDDTTRDHSICAQWDGGTVNGVWNLQFDEVSYWSSNTDVLLYGQKASGDASDWPVVETNTLQIDTTYKYAVTHDIGNSLAIYIDGVDATNNVYNASTSLISDPSSVDFTLGEGADGSKDMSGEQGFLYIYNRILTAQEIAQLHADPYQMFRHGFASDGAYHLDTEDNEAKITFNQTEENPVVVLHDPSIRTGDGSIEHLIGHWKCDDNAASTTILAEVGSNLVLVGGDNTSVLSNIDSVRGTSLLTNGTDDYINFLNGIGDLTTEDEFTIFIKVKPNFNYDVGSNQGLLGLYDSTEYMEVLYDYSFDRFDFKNYLSVPPSVISSPVYTSNIELQQWAVFGFHCNVTEGCTLFSFNGKILGIINGSMAWAGNITTAKISINVFTSYGSYYIDEIKLYDGCVLPYGTFLSAQHVNDDDYSDAHSDITFYWDGSDCTSTDVQIGGVQGTLGSGNTGGSTSFVETGGPANTGYFDNESSGAGCNINFPVSSNDIIIPAFCSISFWCYYNTYQAWDRIISFGSTSHGSFELVSTALEGSLLFYLSNSDTTLYSGEAFDIFLPGIWYFLRIEIDTSNGSGRLYINTKLVIEITDFTGVFQSIDTINVGSSSTEASVADVSIYGLTITNDTYTPELPFVLGHGPICVPKLLKS